MGKVISFFGEIRTELSKVTWAKRDDVIRLTLVVVILSALIGAYLGGLDYLFTKLLEFALTK